MKTTILFAVAFAAFQMSAQAQTTNHANLSYSAGPKEDLSRLAGQMLDDTNKARIALKDGNHQLAAEDVNRASTDLANIEAGAHGAAMIPVYREFVSISILGPVRAEQNARNRKSAHGAVVHEVAGDYTRVSVSTTVAKNGLDAAKAALQKREWKRADGALADVQDGVQMESIESDMPLSRARENLILARLAVRQDHYSEATAALQSAAKALSQYEAEGGSHVSEAKQMQQQISKFAPEIQQEHAQAIATINKWWNTTSNWSPYDDNEQESARR